MKSVFQKIAAGLEDAIAYAQGDKGSAREATVDVKAIRMAQAAFANTFRLKLGVLRDREQGRRPGSQRPLSALVRRSWATLRFTALVEREGWKADVLQRRPIPLQGSLSGRLAPEG